MKKQKCKWYQKCVSWLLVMLIAISLTACSSVTSTDGKTKKIPIKIEDIDWSVDEAVINGQRKLAFSYTNKSNYTITYLELKFKQKDNITSDELAIFDTFKEEYELDDTDIQNLYIVTRSEKQTKAGDTSEQSSLYFGFGMVNVQKTSEYQLMQPDIATIKYVDTDNNVCTFYYDYVSKKYSENPNKIANIPNKQIDTKKSPNTDTIDNPTTTSVDAWKQFLKDYEAWTDKYIEFMKKYKNDPTNTSLISDYGKFVAETAEWADRAQKYEEELENENVSSEIITEYFDTLSRITKKITEAAY